jgi:hypothetical protein
MIIYILFVISIDYRNRSFILNWCKFVKYVIKFWSHDQIKKNTEQLKQIFLKAIDSWVNVGIS